MNDEECFQIVHATPKLYYPYKDNNNREYLEFNDPRIAFYYFATKFNGMNVLVYKYNDSKGNSFVSAKSKGTPFINNGDVGNFLDLFKEALVSQYNEISPKALFKHVPDYVQAISFELYGKKEPHLVNYEEDIALAPLFIVDDEGQIEPIVANWHHDVVKVTNPAFISLTAKQLQFLKFKENERYRAENKLPLKYEFNHFACEGDVLYLLDENGKVINRTLYKIKPKDIEEVHWASFEKDYKGRVLEAISKLKAAEEGITPENLQQELDMGPKEWDKFGSDVLNFVESIKERNSTVLILVGIPGSGKSTRAKLLEQEGWVRICQDDLGSRKLCKKLTHEAILAGKNVVIDRCNFNQLQRKSFIDLAKGLGITKIMAEEFVVPQELAIDRLKNRDNHPTIEKDNPRIPDIVSQFVKDYESPSLDEGFSGIIVHTWP